MDEVWIRLIAFWLPPFLAVGAIIRLVGWLIRRRRERLAGDEAHATESLGS